MTDYVNTEYIRTTDTFDLNKVMQVNQPHHLSSFHGHKHLFINTLQYVEDSAEFIVEGPDVIWDMVAQEKDYRRYKITVKDDDLFLILLMMEN